MRRQAAVRVARGAVGAAAFPRATPSAACAHWQGVLSQPMWGSPSHPGPKLNPTWAKLWNKLE
eukprot:scaffold22274_cov40-Tisochrysis_lutea.AAC.1